MHRIYITPSTNTTIVGRRRAPEPRTPSIGKLSGNESKSPVYKSREDTFPGVCYVVDDSQ